MRSVLRAPSTRFIASSLFLIAACALLLRSRLFALSPEVAAWGVTFDVTITIPLLYWLFVVRAGKAPLITLAPLFVLCTFLATAMVPRPQQQFLSDLRRVAVPVAEVALVVAVGRRLRATRGRDPIRALLGDSRVAEVVESEIAILSYAVAGWRMKPEPVEGRAITFHERSGWPGVLACIFVLIAAEGVAMHLFLARVSAVAAWSWTMLDLWAVIWLLGDYHALRLQRSVLTSSALQIRLGLRWAVDIPLSSIASIDEIRHEREWRRRDVMRLAILEEPRWLITLHEPIVAKGLAGFRREIRALAMLPDDEEAISALRLALSQVTPRDGSSAHR